MKKILWVVLAFISINANAGNSWDNEIDWIIASSAASSQSHIIQWKKSFPNDDCKVGEGQSFRTRLSQDDKELYALMLASHLSGKTVSFKYSTELTSGAVQGHGSVCQLVNAWVK